jgi:alpha-galactosidase
MRINPRVYQYSRPGAMLLDGDDLTQITPQRLTMLKKLYPPTGKAAVFADESFGTAEQDQNNHKILFMFNWDDVPESRALTIPENR